MNFMEGIKKVMRKMNRKFLIFISFLFIISVLGFSDSYIIGIRNFRSTKVLLEKNTTFKELFVGLDELFYSSFATVAMESGIEVERMERFLDDDIVISSEKTIDFNFSEFLLNPAEYLLEILNEAFKDNKAMSLIFRCQNVDDARIQRGLLSKIFENLCDPVKINEFVVLNARENPVDPRRLVSMSKIILDKLSENIFVYGRFEFEDEDSRFFGKLVDDMIVFKVERENNQSSQYFSELLNLPVMFGYSVSIDPRDRKTFERELERFEVKKDILNLIEEFSDLIGRVLISIDIGNEAEDKKMVIFLKGDGKEIMKKVDQGIPGLFVKNDDGVKLYSYLGEWDIAFGNWYMVATKNVDPVSVAIRVETGNRYDTNHIYYRFKKLGVEIPFCEKIIDLNQVFGKLLNSEIKHFAFYQRGVYLDKLIDILFIK